MPNLIRTSLPYRRPRAFLPILGRHPYRRRGRRLYRRLVINGLRHVILSYQPEEARGFPLIIALRVPWGPASHAISFIRHNDSPD